MEIKQAATPNNLEAEEYLLGSIFIDNSIISVLDGRLKQEDFAYRRYGEIYASMLSLHKAAKIIDELNVLEYYEKLGFGSKKLIENLIKEIIDNVPTSSYVETYLDIVLEKSIQRVLLHNMEKLRSSIINNKADHNEILDVAEKDIYDVIKKRRTTDIVDISEASDTYFEEINKRIQTKDRLTGINTGYERINKLTSGLQPGEFIIIAARPSVGKTAFALNLAANIASNDEKHVAFFSLEMSINQIMQRLFCMAALIDADKLKTGDISNDEMVTLGVANYKLKNLNIHFDEGSANRIGDIRAKCRKLKQQNQLDVLIIDYLQLITSDKNIRHEGVSEISRSLKLLSRELNIPVIALSQLSRSIENREDKRPLLSDLRESGSLEQDADIVMFLFRRSDLEPDDESVLDNEVKKVKEDNNIRQIILKIEKNRQGSLGHVDFDFYGAQSRYVESDIQQDIYYVKKKKKKHKEK